jgi:superfamily II RNA helicase
LGRKLLEIYPRSFHYFQSRDKRRREGYQSIEQKLALLEELGHISENKLTLKGEFAASLFGYELLLSEMHDKGILEELNEVKLNILISGLVFEPRKNDQLPRLSPEAEKLRKTAEGVSHFISRREMKYRIFPYTKMPYFHLAAAVEAWTRGAKFEKLSSLTSADEGELVRYFRMIIQLLRELQRAPHTSDKLKQTAERARHLIDRDVVDAEKQLRV